MALLPDTLRVETHQLWAGGNPPQPLPAMRVDMTMSSDDGTVFHKWYDGSKWSGWENLGHP